MADTSNAGRHFSEASFAAKVSGVFGRASCEVLRAALTLHELLRSKDTPLWAKAAIVAALGYFVLPTDAVPDFLPVVGFSDDLGVMLALLSTLEAFVSEDIRRKVEKRLPGACRRK
jgi:uncharacterized membrane protein YkvA (DUF1232 family)